MACMAAMTCLTKEQCQIIWGWIPDAVKTRQPPLLTRNMGLLVASIAECAGERVETNVANAAGITDLVPSSLTFYMSPGAPLFKGARNSNKFIVVSRVIVSII